MKYRIRSRAKATKLGLDAQPITKFIPIDIILEFDHVPSDEEIQNKLDRHPEYLGYMLQFLEMFKKDRIE